MRIEKLETSLPLLLFPLLQVRAWMGFPRNACTDIARDTSTGFRYFTSLYSAFLCRICFLLQVLPGNLKSFLHPRSKSSSKAGSQAHEEFAIHKPGGEQPPLSRQAHLPPRGPRPDPEAAGTNGDVNTPRCNKQKYAPFHTSVTWGWISALKEGLDIPSARFGVPKNNKAGFKIAALSCTLWGNSKANHFNLFWTDTKFKKKKGESCQASSS